MAHRHTPSHSSMTSRTTTPILSRVGYRSSLGGGPSSVLAQAGGLVSSLSAGAQAGAAAGKQSKQTSYEWVLRDVRAVQAALEAGDEDAVEGPIFDDGAYKLHLEHTISDAGDDPGSRPTSPTASLSVQTSSGSLTLAVIALWAKYADVPPDEPFERHVFVGLHRVGAGASAGRPGSLGEPDWVWQTSDVVSFSNRQEYWETRVPDLNTLVAPPKPAIGLASLDAVPWPRVGAVDVAPVDLALRVVIKHSTDNAAPLVHADQQFIARRVARQAAALLDSPTADVTFVVLETEPSPRAPSTVSSPRTPVLPAPRAADAHVLARKRTLGAHSAVLVQSPYFAALLSSGLAESAGQITIDDAEFATLYWVLYYVYTDEIAFATPARSGDDVRAIVARQNLDPAAVRRVIEGAGWEWTVVADEDGTSEHSRGPSETEPSPRSHSRLSAASTSAISTTSLPPQRKPPIPPRTGSTAAAASSASSATVVSSPRRPSAAKPPPSPRYATPRRPPPPDPHPHSCAAPPPAPALAVYILAHRYGLDELVSLAHGSILGALEPATSVSVLLATHAYAELHADVLAHITENWAEIAGSPELDRCFQEVSSGVWGENRGGLVLLGLMRRLTGTV
ncbi:hypothetical protein Q5752_004743 [Cryptotrichosporon argae]